MEENKIIVKKPAEEITFKEVVANLKDWTNYMLTKWVFIILMFLVGAGLGLTYAFVKKPVYTARTTFVLEEADKGGGLGQYAGIASMVGIDLGGGGGGIFEGDNILELYKSRKMIEKTLLTPVIYKGKEEFLIDHFIRFNQLREKWSDRPELSKINFDRKADADENLTRLQDSVITLVVKEINKNYLIVAKPDKKLTIIKAEIRSEDEFFSKTFNEEIVKNVNDFYVQTKTKKSQANISILQEKTDSVRTVMNGAIYTGAAATDATPNINPSRQVQRMVPLQRSQFTAETNKAVLAELLKNLEISKISLLKETPLIQVIDQPVFPLERTKISKALSPLLGGILFIIISILYLSIRKKIQEGN